MKTLIAYATKNGATAKCAKRLAEHLENVTLLDLTKEEPCLADFDTIIIGSCIRGGKLHKEAKRFMEENLSDLKQKKTAYFICCGFPEQKADYFSKNFPDELLQNALAYDCFGGEFDPSKLKGMDKLVAKMVTKAVAGKVAPAKILYENIENFACKVRG